MSIHEMEMQVLIDAEDTDGGIWVTVEFEALRDHDIATRQSWVDIDVLCVRWRGVNITSVLSQEEIGKITDHIDGMTPAMRKKARREYSE